MAATRTGGDDLTENWASDNPAQSSKKRKHDSDKTPQPAAASTAKKAKQPTAVVLKQLKQSKQPAKQPAASSGSQRPLCFLSAAEQATGFWQLYLQSKGGKLLTSIEQDESVPASAIAVVAASSDATTPEGSSHPLTALPAHIRKSLGAAAARRLTAPPTNPPAATNQPQIVVLCSSATRCTQYIKALHALRLPHLSLLKAFARHLRLSDQAAQLDGSDVRICVGTPRRVYDLMVGGWLMLDRVVLCVVDGGEDAKRYNLLTLGEVKDDFWTLYQRLHPAVRAGKVKLTIF